MSRRDMILIAVLVNAGLLTVLFVTAIKSDPEPSLNPTLEMSQIALAPSQPIALSQQVADEATQNSNDAPMDEVDHVLREYLPDVENTSSVLTQEVQTPVLQEIVVEQKTVEPAQTVSSATPELIEVTVKKGDFLEKIAKNNRTTVDAIRKANNLKNDNLKVGQVLKVPVGTAKAKTEKSVKKETSQVTTSSNTHVATGDAVYHTVKAGDNPWKIAKQYGVKFDDILRLNNLDQDRAKNLKAGDKIRVK